MKIVGMLRGISWTLLKSLVELRSEETALCLSS